MNTLRLTAFVALFGCVSLQAQDIDYNKVILPDRVQSPDFGEKLVQLAWKNHPTNEILRREMSIAQLKVGRASAEWLDLITIQGNINEFNINSDNTDVPVFFPRYNFGIMIPLGIFISNPNTAKQNHQQLSIAREEINAKKLEVRNVVLKAYNVYLLRERVYKIQAQQYSDKESTYKLIERRFQNGEITFDVYTASQSELNRASIQLLESDLEFKNAKLDLEQLIGVRLEDVM
jgi:outer membrane protein TolC